MCYYIYYRVPQLKLDYSRRLFFHLLNNFLMFKIRFHILQIWTFYDISSFFDLLLQKLISFQKNFFYPIFFQKKLKIFFDNFLFEMLVNYFWNTALVKISWYVFQKWWIFIANWKFSKKKFFFGKNWFVNKYLAFIKNWWYIIKLHSLVYMKTYFGHQFMILKKFFLKKLICEKIPSLSQKMIICHKMYMSGVYENVFEASEINS